MVDQPFERGDVRGRQITDMDIIADAGAVGRRIIRAENGNVIAFSDSRLDCNLDEMR